MGRLTGRPAYCAGLVRHAATNGLDPQTGSCSVVLTVHQRRVFLPSWTFQLTPHRKLLDHGSRDALLRGGDLVLERNVDPLSQISAAKLTMKAYC